MKLIPKSEFRLDELAAHIEAELHGDATTKLSGVAPLAEAESGDLSFYADAQYRELLFKTKATAIITRKRLDMPIPQLVHPDPVLAMNALSALFHPEAPPPCGVSPLAQIADDAEIESGASIGPFVIVNSGARIGARSVLHPGTYIGRNARIGEDCVLWPNVFVGERCQLGNRVRIHPGAVIGADGFGYARRDLSFHKLNHFGIVILEDDVEIGANAAIDRATLGKTVLARGVKLDNLVHVGHNVHIGDDSVMAAQGGVSGSTVIGKRVMMGGQVGMVDHLVIGDDAVLVAQSGVIGNVAAGSMVSGYPARPHKEVLKSHAALRRLDRLRRQVRELERALDELQKDELRKDTSS